MTTELDAAVRTMVRTGLDRLVSAGVFITVAPEPRTYVDRILCGILERWTGDVLEYRVVTSARVQALVVATAPDAVWHVDNVATMMLEPYVARASARLAH